MNLPGHQSPKDQKTLLKAFISTFTSEGFMVDLVRITLHPSEFNSFSSEKSNSTIDYIKDFLKVLNDTSRKLQLTTLKNIQSQIKYEGQYLELMSSNDLQTASSLVTILITNNRIALLVLAIKYKY